MDQCKHTNTTQYTTGGLHFSEETGPWDDIEIHIICLDCGKEINPPESQPTLEPYEPPI